jgi:hypothetical protein
VFEGVILEGKDIEGVILEVQESEGRGWQTFEKCLLCHHPLFFRVEMCHQNSVIRDIKLD